MVEQLLEIDLNGNAENFLKIMETLTRMGVCSKSTLYQSCHILHKRQKYYLVHFKELFGLDGKASNISEEDLTRRNTIAMLLEQWGLCKVIRPSDFQTDLKLVKVIPHSEKKKWTLESKYTIGKRK